MLGRLFIRIDEHFHTESEIEYWVAQGDAPCQKATLGEMTTSLYQHFPQYSSYRTTVIIPVESCLMSKVEMPSRQAKQIKQALPFLLEDIVIEPIEENFIAIGHRQGRATLPVACIAKKTLDQWLAIFATYHIVPESLIIDALMLSTECEMPTLLIDGERTLIQVDQQYALSGDIANINILLESLLLAKEDAADKNTATPQKIKCFYSVEEEKESLIEVLQQSNLEGLTLEFEMQASDQVLAYLAANLIKLPKTNQFNLLQQSYKTKGALSKPTLPFKWKPVALAASLCLCFYFAALTTEQMVLTSAIKNFDSSIKSEFKKIFPSTRNFTRMKQRVQTVLEGDVSSGDSQFLSLLSVSALAVKNLNEGPTTSESKVQPTRFSYDNKQQKIKFDVEANNYEILNILKQNIENSGAAVEIASAASEGDSVKGRLIIGN